MITITLDRTEKLDKTHFSDLDELLAYLNNRLNPKFPHDNPKFMKELERRSGLLRDNPNEGIDFDEGIKAIRKSSKRV
ncbi:MAG: hypothetical protein JXQ87_14505 [Bacteroidia bacterium]